MRLCVDYRALKKKTVPDRHPIPRIKESLMGRLRGNSWFCVFDHDQGKAYHQGFIGKQSQPLPALSALANFQRFMENGLRELRDEMCIPQLDDIIVFSESFSDHIEHLRKVLQCLKSHEVKLKAATCTLFKREVPFLGRLVSKDGYQMDPKVTSAVTTMKYVRPKTVGEVRRLMGSLGVYRRHINDFARISKSIQDLLSDRKEKVLLQPNRHKNSAVDRYRLQHQQSGNPAISLLGSKILLNRITSPPVLAYPDYNSPY